jgi:hypothetical protein
MVGPTKCSTGRTRRWAQWRVQRSAIGELDVGLNWEAPSALYWRWLVCHDCMTTTSRALYIVQRTVCHDNSDMHTEQGHTSELRLCIAHWQVQYKNYYYSIRVQGVLQYHTSVQLYYSMMYYTCALYDTSSLVWHTQQCLCTSNLWSEILAPVPSPIDAHICQHPQSSDYRSFAYLFIYIYLMFLMQLKFVNFLINNSFHMCDIHVFTQ